MIKVEFPSKHLHSQKGEDDNKEKEEEEKGGDGADRVEKRGHKIAQRSPVPKNCKQMLHINTSKYKGKTVEESEHVQLLLKCQRVRLT